MPSVIITKKVKFNAAHRLHSDVLSDEENVQVFGKCNNPKGHGHNYILEVSLKGEVSPENGMVANLTEVKSIIETVICDRFDHKHLNEDVEEFKKLVPTAENIAIVSWNLLKKTAIGPQLVKVVIHETDTNSCEYAGED